jgi:DNA-binding response OmpR family regulator
VYTFVEFLYVLRTALIEIAMPFKIQIVEDDIVTVTFLSKKLTSVGFEVHTAFHGKSALEQIKKNQPDLIILDFFLPDVDGLWVLINLRKGQDKVPAVIVSSGIDDDQKKMLQAQGIFGYWQKPYNIHNLIIEIEKILQSRLPEARSPQKTILVVDDDANTLRIIKIALEIQGYGVITCSDGQSALQAVHIHNPDLIILDLIMPDLNGWRFTQILKQEEKYAKYKDIPIIILSAFIAEEGAGENSLEGDFLMAKPFDIQKMLAKVKELLPNSINN